MKKLLFTIIITLFIISGCGGAGNPTAIKQQSQGSLTLNIRESGVKAQTIESGLDMNIASYDIAGSGPSGTGFHKNDVPANGALVTINALAEGNWTITVDAKNAAGVIIASGVANIMVFAGVSTPLEITVKPLAGTGALEVGVSWPAGIITNPVVAGTLTPVGGSPMNISFTLSADGLSATYQNSALPAGYYVLRVQLKDGTIVKWGCLESVRVIARQTSSGDFPLTANPGSIGDIELIINPDLQNPITITFSGEQAEIPVGSEMTVTATTSEPVDAYQWYINGTLLTEETEPSISIGSSLAPGVYRLDLVVTKGNIVSTGYVEFTVESVSIIALAGGPHFSLFLTDGGRVLACGLNNYGQLGNGTNTNSNLPTPILNLTAVTAIAGGLYHSLALSGGAVWAFGYNGYGQLGIGSVDLGSNIPVSVRNLSGVTAIACGSYHNLALCGNTVWAWGKNNNGQLGNGTNTNSNLPLPVSNLTGVMAIACGAYHSLALKNDGTVWAWGSNGNGELGIGTTTNHNLPVQISSLTNIIAIACGSFHNLALRSDGTVWVWGHNGSGELGIGTTSGCTLPVQVNLPEVIAIAGGYAHSLALSSDGTVWVWGNNTYGQLGNGVNTDSYYPVKVNNLNGITVTGIAGGGFHNLAMGAGKVWAWGLNELGQLGNGTTTDSNVPVEVRGI